MPTSLAVHTHPSLCELLENSEALPSIPKIVSDVLRELDMAEPNARNIVALVSTDPALATKLIALANSPLFGSSRNVESLHDAVTLLGFSHVRTLVTTAALANAFTTVAQFDLLSFWQYSLNAALVAKNLAPHIGMNESAAFTAGLVHCIGELVLRLGAKDSMTALHQTSFMSFEYAALQRDMLGYTYADVGAAFIDLWDFPPTLVNALNAYARQVRYNTIDGEPSNALAAVLHLASWRARVQMLALTLAEEELHDHFPMHAALSIGLSMQDVLAKDPQQWSGASQASMFVR